jgi:hypothetical protein
MDRDFACTSIGFFMKAPYRINLPNEVQEVNTTSPIWLLEVKWPEMA